MTGQFVPRGIITKLLKKFKTSKFTGNNIFYIYIYPHLTSVSKRVMNVLHKALQGF